MLASFVWFFSLAYGAAWLVPLFRRPVAWRVLDVLIGGVMWSLRLSDGTLLIGRAIKAEKINSSFIQLDSRCQQMVYN
jgi:hypothetical protein